MTEKETPTKDAEIHSSTHIKVAVYREANCHITLEVEADATIVKEAKKTALKDIAKEVSIPGFRKGKAPAAILEKKFPEAVKEQTEKAFADKAFIEGNRLAKVFVLNGKSKITFKMLSLDETGGKASFSFEAEPTLPEIETSKFTLKEIHEDPIEETKLEEIIDSIRMFYATWNDIEDQPIKEGNFVTLDIDDLDQDPPVQAFSNARFEVKPKKMATWMRDLVIGKKKGESVEGTSQADEEESEEIKKEFKNKKVKIHIKSVEEAVLPELNDEFASRLGVNTAAEMKERIKSLLKQQEKDRVLTNQRAQIADQIHELYHFEIPATVLEQEVNARLSSFLKQPGMTKKWNEQYSEEEKTVKKNEIKEEAEKAIRLFYICRKIIQDQKITLTEEELSPSYDTLLDMMFADPARVNFRNQSKQQQAMEYSKFMMAKAQDYLLSQLKK